MSNPMAREYGNDSIGRRSEDPSASHDFFWKVQSRLKLLDSYKFSNPCEVEFQGECI